MLCTAPPGTRFIDLLHVIPPKHDLIYVYIHTYLYIYIYIYIYTYIYVYIYTYIYVYIYVYVYVWILGMRDILNLDTTGLNITPVSIY